MSISRTVIISCAGMGNRLGVGMTKALIEVDRKPLIIRHLEMLHEEKDIRIVVGFQSEKVIETVRKYREDVIFVFNHEYRHTGTGASVSMAAKFANEYIISLDGDLLVHPEDMKTILQYENEFICGTEPGTDDPWMVKAKKYGNNEVVESFSHESGDYEWTGIVQVKSDRINFGNGHVYQLLEPLLPMPLIKVRTKEIDTINDYEKAVEWVKRNYGDNTI